MTGRKYKRIYEMLKAKGHDPAKAATIIIDANREVRHARKPNNRFAMTWIKSIRRI